MFKFLPDSVLQMSTIFLSIVIEALPFVMLGCFISGALQVFLTPERVNRILPKNKLLSICFGCFMGFFFPSCECGIVPIVHRFVEKKVPVYTAFAFMLTAPIVNPIVIFSTYTAFSNVWSFPLMRIGGSFVVAAVIGIWLAYFQKEEVLKDKFLAETASCKVQPRHHHEHDEHTKAKHGFLSQLNSVLVHALDEFFDTGRYLMFGGLIASSMQVYLPTGMMLTLGSTKVLGILVMIFLAFTMSLCSEADAFIGSSLLSLFGRGPVVGFLVFGPMVDIKNLLMMNRYFKGKFILKLIGLIMVAVFCYALVV